MFVNFENIQFKKCSALNHIHIKEGTFNGNVNQLKQLSF